MRITTIALPLLALAIGDSAWTKSDSGDVKGTIVVRF